MKMKKVLAAAAASVLAVSAMAVVASADPILTSKKTGESGKPDDFMWELNIGDDAYDADTLAKVDKVVLTVTSTAYVNGGMGGNVIKEDGTTGWLASPQGENSSAGTNTWTWEGVGGLYKGIDEETGDQAGYFKAEVWWQNVNDDGSDSTVTFDKIEFLDASGAVLYTLGSPAETPSTDDDNKPADDDNKPAADDDNKTDDNKNNVDTGVEGVAAVFGVAVVAAGAMVVAKKRK